jgi:glycosyltransferase involved in cell wall biosynthesis
MGSPTGQPQAARKRVAVLNTHPIQHFAPLWREIAKIGEVELKVFYCSDWGVKESADSGFGTVFKWDVDLLGGYDSEFLSIHRRPKELGFWETDNREVSDALARFSPNILVIFGYSHLADWRALLWARRHGVRVLVFSDSELKHWRPLWTKIAKEIVVRSFLSQADGVLPIGNSNAEYYRHYGVPDGRMHWAAYPVDGGRFVSSVTEPELVRAAIRQRYNIGSAHFVFATVGKYIPRKRHQDVIRAWLLLNEDLQRRSCVMLVGEGPLRPTLEKLASAAPERIILTGFVNQAEIPLFYAGSDALVVASDIDAHPLVVTESLFFGRPVIASDLIGCLGPDDTVRDGENALVYPCGDIHRLAHSMALLMEDSALYKQFAIRSREIAEGQDVRACATKFNDAFRKVMGSKRVGFVEGLSRFITGSYLGS